MPNRYEAVMNKRSVRIIQTLRGELAKPVVQAGMNAAGRNGGTVLQSGLIRNYFDSAGTTAATVDNPVGLVLDAAGTTGPNVFSDAAVVFGGESTRVSVGVYRVYSSAGVYSSVSVGAGLTPYKTYRLRFYQDTATAGTLAVDGPAGAVTGFTGGVGEKECVITMTATTAVSIKRSGGVTDIQISNVRIEELTGNHATQATTGSKPTLRRGLVNQLLWSGDFTNAAWTKLNATIEPNAATTPDGYFAGRLVENTANNLHGVLPTAFPAVTSGAVYTLATVVKAAGRTAIYVRDNGSANAGAYFNLSTGDAYSAEAGVVAATSSPLGDGWHLCVVTYTTSSAACNAQVRLVSTGTTMNYTGDGVSGAFVHRYGLFTGTVTAQQILAAGGIPLTTTAPASSALGNYWWQFSPDAPGDYLQTGITTGNEGWVCAGVNFAPGATLQTVVSSGGGDANQKGVFFFSYNGAAVYAYVGNGTARALAQAPISTSVPQVVSMGWSAAGVIAGANNTESTPTAFTGDVTGPLPLRIGQYTGGTATHNGPMSVTVICPTLPPPADRKLIIRWVGSEQGQTL